MKNTILLFLLLPFFAVGQVDTTAVRAEVDSLIDSGEKLARFGQTSEVLEIAERTKLLVENHLGKEDKRYASCLQLFGLYYLVTGNYLGSDSMFLRVKKIQEEDLRTEDEEYGKTLNYLGHVNWRLGNYELAEDYFLEANRIWQSLFGIEHLNYAGGLNNLGILYMDMGHLESAAILLEKTYEIRKIIKGEKSQETAASLGNLGILYKRMGKYKEAEEKYLQAKKIWEETVGKEHVSYIKEIGNLGVLYIQLGLYDLAEANLTEAKILQLKINGKDNQEFVNILTSLGLLYLSTGNHELAEQEFKEAKEIWFEIHGNRHPYYASILGNLGIVYFESQKYELAEKVFTESREIWLEIFGKQSDDYAFNTYNLGHLYEKMGKIDLAESYLIEANEIIQEINGFKHPSVGKLMYGLANFYWRKNSNRLASEYIRKSLTLQNYLITEACKHLSEKELYSNVKLYEKKKDGLFSFISTPGADFVPLDTLQAFKSLCYDNSLLHKGFLLNAALKVRNIPAADSTANAKYNSLLSYHRRLAAEYAKPIAERQNVAELEEKANALEKELVRTVAGYGDAIRQVEWPEVRDALQPGEAAVEFVHYDYYTPDPTDSVMYAALVLRPGDEAPRFIPLFEEKELQALLQENPRDKKAYLNELYGPKKKKAASPSLHRLIWQPLEELLADAETVYASPSGLLHRINLGAVMMNKRKSWADRHELVLLGSTRQLTNNQQPPLTTSLLTTSPPVTATLYGGIRYDMDSTAIARANQGEPPIASIGGELPFFPPERSERSLLWEELPGTAKEAEEIAAIIKKQKGEAEALKGYNATEESFKRLGQDGPSPRILHIATHGYFYPDPAPPSPPEGGELAASSPSLGGGWGEAPPFKISDHPMIRSGLAMAGGNQAWRGRHVPKGLEDGILTAYEVSQVDLRNTELVVLSACETGLGDIEGNEGVYGLQRAFKIAGADKLIMSLWNVPDAQTKEMMVLFYRNWLEEGMELNEAFRAAQGEMRKRYGEHYYWAAFVLIE